MNAEVKDGFLIIKIPLIQPSRPSASGNVATNVIVEGKPVIIGLNAYIKK